MRRQGANLNFKQEQQRNLISVENASEISRLFPNRFRARLPASHPSLRPQEISRRRQRRPWQLPLSLRKRYIISLLCCERRGGRTDSIINYSTLPLSRKHRAARVLPMVRGDMLCQEQRGSSDEDTIYSATPRRGVSPNGMGTHAHSTRIIIPRGYCRASPNRRGPLCLSLSLIISKWNNINVHCLPK